MSHSLKRQIISLLSHQEVSKRIYARIALINGRYCKSSVFLPAFLSTPTKTGGIGTPDFSQNLPFQRQTSPSFFQQLLDLTAWWQAII